MRRKIKSIDPKEFEDAGEFNKTSMKGEMRKLYKEINRKMKDLGWTANDIVAWFNKQDIPMTVSLFRIYLWDIDQEHGYKRSTDEYVNPTQFKKSKQKITMQNERSTDAVPSPRLNSSLDPLPKNLIKSEEKHGVKIGDKPKTFEHDPSPDENNLL